MKMPGITISPRPRIEYCGGVVERSLGNCNLIGASMF
jgi:hypothetical protein